jgi:hypothetical protein
MADDWKKATTRELRKIVRKGITKVWIVSNIWPVDKTPKAFLKDLRSFPANQKWEYGPCEDNPKHLVVQARVYTGTVLDGRSIG